MRVLAGFAALLLIVAPNCYAQDSHGFNVKPYDAPFWLPGGDLQTIYPALFGNEPKIKYRRERWELDDGDFIDADWLDTTNSTAEDAPELNTDAASPVVVLFHGLEGNSESLYAKTMMAEVNASGWRGVVIHFRGCSGEPNRLPRAYFAGDSAEIDRMLGHVQATYPDAPLYVVGVSLGGNALLKWLGEYADRTAIRVSKAVTISAPMDLEATADALDYGLNRILYTPRFVTTMKTKALNKLKQFPGIMDEAKVHAAQSIHDIDREVTAKLHGYVDEVDYYTQNSAKPWLSKIALPTLILNAKNDPFMPASALPSKEDVSSSVTLEYPETGGHVGFLDAPFPGRTDWLPKRVMRFFSE